MSDPREALRVAVRKQFRIHGGVTEDAVADAVAEVLAPTVASMWTKIEGPSLARCVCGIAHGVPDLDAAARSEIVEQFKTALLTGLDDLERLGNARLLSPGDVADLVHRVALEVGR